MCLCSLSHRIAQVPCPCGIQCQMKRKSGRRPTSVGEKRAHLRIPHAVCFWGMEAQDFNLVDFLLDLTGPWWEIYRRGSGKLPPILHSILLWQNPSWNYLRARWLQAAINSVLGGVLRALIGTSEKRHCWSLNRAVKCSTALILNYSNWQCKNSFALIFFFFLKKRWTWQL